MFLAIRDIRNARGRFALMGGVVALISLLLVLLSGLTAGLGNQSTSAIAGLGTGPGGTGVDRIAFGVPAGEKPSFTNSEVTAAQVEAWARQPGVASAVPLGVSQTRLQSPGGTTNVAVFGVGTAASGTQAGLTPSSVRAGTVVLGKTAAKDLAVAVGDTVTVGGTTLRVGGIVADQWYSHTPAVWTTLPDWAKLSHAGSLATVIAVTYDAGASAAADAADAAGTVSTTRPGAFAALGGYTSEHGSLLMMQGFLYGISALVIVAFLTVWTVQRTRDIAVLKALGASGGYLLRDALVQAALVLVAGAGLGALVGVGGGLLAATAAPFLLTPATTLLPAAGIVLLGLAGAVLAVRNVTRIDPLIALGGN
ncbi:ABC transporter permease [Specibacter cremeus]|uniref:ABC transporter permease n=1 Tax=Specibacter cremeus TaxID=1629051 RepID=UPI000F79F3DB|nr:ABC transporter permease [Specibacter cremeus]